MILQELDDPPESALLQRRRPSLDIREGLWVIKPSQWADLGLRISTFTLLE